MATDRLGSVAYKFGTGLAVQNFGFESYQLAPWAPYGEAQVSISNVSRTGGQSMRLTTTVADRGAYQDVKGLVAGRDYQFQAWVRAESGTNTGAFAVCDPAGGGFVWTNVRTITTDWQLLSVWFTATSKGTAWVFLAKWDTTGALLWDDVELVNGATAISGVKMRYYPYGQEVGTATANDTAKFGTYTRDSGSGLDYAMNRYYQSTWGRFTTADPYRASGGPADPGSWNRYSYVQGDPVSYGDPSGLLALPIDPIEWSSGSTLLDYLFAAAVLRAMFAVENREDCYSALNAKDKSSAEQRIGGMTYGWVHMGLPRFKTGKAGMLERVEDSPPMATYAGGFLLWGKSVAFNADINWLNPDDSRFINTDTGTSEQYRALSAKATQLEVASISVLQFMELTILHEIAPSFRKEHPGDTDAAIKQYDKDIWDKCIK